MDFFLLKTILIKLIVLIVGTTIFSIIFFELRLNALYHNSPTFNTGVGLSLFKDSPQQLVYFIKWIVVIVFLFFFIFCNQWYFIVAAFTIWFNGLLNVIDKLMEDLYQNEKYYDAVVDYIHIFNSIANVADIFISIGVGGYLISIIYFIFKNNSDKKKNQDEAKEINEVMDNQITKTLD